MVSYKYLFEFDPTKNRSNLEKHGITFEEAAELWDQPVLTLKSRNRAEDRNLVIGKIGRDYWTAITTLRENNIRIISVRRARHEEKELYKRHYG